LAKLPLEEHLTYFLKNTKSSIPLEEARKEITESNRHIENELDQEITSFCYPNGEIDDFNDDVMEILRRNVQLLWNQQNLFHRVNHFTDYQELREHPATILADS